MHPRYQDLARPPRPVPFPLWAGLMTNFYFCFGSMFLAIGLAVFWGLAYPSLREFRFWFAGTLTPARGTLVASEKTQYSEGGSKHRSGTPVYRYRYRFTDAMGEERQGVSFTTGDRFGRAEQVEVEFDPDNPAVSRMVGARASPFGLAVMFVLLFPGIGVPFFVIGVRDGIRSIRLLVEGRVASGRIVARKATGTRINRMPVWDFEVEFETSAGARHRFHHKTHLTHEIGDEPEEPVFYDPRRPERAVLADGLPARAQVGRGGHWESDRTVGPVVLFVAMVLIHVAHVAVAVIRIAIGE